MHDAPLQIEGILSISEIIAWLAENTAAWAGKAADTKVARCVHCRLLTGFLAQASDIMARDPVTCSEQTPTIQAFHR